MKNLIVLIIFMGTAFSVNAGRCQNCTIKFVGCSYKHQGKEHCNVFFNENITNRESGSCYESSDNRMALDITTDGGKAMLSIALSAKASSQKVTAYGAKVCDVITPYETIDLLYIGDV